MNRKTLEYLKKGHEAKLEARKGDDKLVQERIERGGRDAPKKGIEGMLRNTLGERDQETKLVTHDDDEAVFFVEGMGWVHISKKRHCVRISQSELFPPSV